MGLADFASKRLKIRSQVLRIIFAEFQGNQCPGKDSNE